ncbi:hypothetical protein C8R42DRAFT_676444 [Lentinula raphanica]|nr:hypothetical protein C8R42DRAFT_676444 [Lentinula raphanica]
MVQIIPVLLAASIIASAYAKPIVTRSKICRAVTDDGEEESSPADIARRAFAGCRDEPSLEDLSGRSFAANGGEPSQGDIDRRNFGSLDVEPGLEERAFAGNGKEPSQGDLDEIFITMY